LSLLEGSPGYQATLKKVNSKLGAARGGSTFTTLDGWGPDVDTLTEDDEKKIPAKTMERVEEKTMSRSNRTDRKLPMTPTTFPDSANMMAKALLSAVLTLTNKVEAMEDKWTTVKEKKKCSKSEDSDNSGSDSNKPSARSHTSQRRTDRHKREGTDEDSEEESHPKSKASKSKTKAKSKLKKKYYGVARGRNPGVHSTWEEAKRQVNGFRNAKHKSFKTKAEARAYVDAHRKDTDSKEEEDFDEGNESPDPSGSKSEASLPAA
jgi:hypothetical protein